MSTRYEPVIGLEVHAQLATNSKVFCACKTDFGATPNEQTCPVCLALPGVLPVLNEKVVEYAVRAALAVGGEIQPCSVFARKNYFYPDLPKGYQISQYELPYNKGGTVQFFHDGVLKCVELERIHIEEDAGKLVHDQGGKSAVDLNRAGTPLIEIVSKPVLRSASEAAEYLRALRRILRYIGVCDGNMDEGSLRCDANVSIRLKGESRLGTRAEIKNVNSFRFVEKAIEYEIARQEEVLEGGGKIVQETRLWDSVAHVTRSMRSKEEANDYRYFPDPDLPPLEISAAYVASIRETLPELPMSRIKRYVEVLGLPDYDARVLTDEKAIADYFEAACGVCTDAKKVSNWIMTELLASLNKDNLSIEACRVTPHQLGTLLKLVETGKISGKIAKEIWPEMLLQGTDPEQIISQKGLGQISDAATLEAVIATVIAANPTQHAQYKAGKDKLFGFFVGQVMKETKGQGNPDMINDLLKKAL